jgi:integrase
MQPRKASKLDRITELSNLEDESPDFLTEAEWERLYRAIDKPRDRAIFSIAYHAGLRASEVGLLQMRDYQRKATVNGMDRIYVHRLKGSHSGDHHLAREEAKALRAWLKIRGDHQGPIFCSNRSRPISRKQLHVLMRQYGAIAELPAHLRHFHVLKHTCATHLLSRGMHVDQVQDWIGHANIQNTMIYARVTNVRREEMAQRLQGWR